MGSLGSILGSMGSIWVTVVIFGLLDHNSETFRAINLKLGTDTYLGSGKMPFHFGVNGVNFGVAGA